jgi:hypothetical protein
METLSLTTEETRRYWRFEEDEFRHEVLERALAKARALKHDVTVQDADGIVLEHVPYCGEK